MQYIMRHRATLFAIVHVEQQFRVLGYLERRAQINVIIIHFIHKNGDLGLFFHNQNQTAYPRSAQTGSPGPVTAADCFEPGGGGAPLLPVGC